MEPTFAQVETGGVVKMIKELGDWWAYFPHDHPVRYAVLAILLSVLIYFSAGLIR